MRATLEQQTGMIDAYLSGLSSDVAANKFGFSGETCTRLLRKNGIHVRTSAESCRLPEYQEKEIIAAYTNSDESADEIGSKYGRTGNTVYLILKRYGINADCRYGRNRIYKINENYFDIIDTEEKAYWLGFLTADGGVSKVSSLRVMLKASDKEHLDKFTKALESEHPVKEGMQKSSNGKWYPEAHVDVHSLKLTKTLSRYGIVQNKSFTVVPHKLDGILEVAYWRGVVDGDGWLENTITKTGYPSKRIGLVGNLAVVNGFRDFIFRKFGFDATVNPVGNIYDVRYVSKTTSVDVARLLYKDAHVYLERKKQLAQEIIYS